MARRRRAEKRKVIPDPVYGSDVVSRFINSIMKSGKKSVAERIVYGALEKIAKQQKVQPEQSLEVLYKGFDNVSPTVEVKAKRVGGSTYQIPVEVRSDRKLALAMRWIIEAARGRGSKSMAEKLAAEILDAAESRGAAFKKKEEMHRMAKANQAFAHIRAN
ncbi:MAG TPA: 30S ribosomal protein S7 [Gammaproteobacteria bacterium]|nr:30S ribosomal protein S7 [Gammaproteobacteria bacterium]